jgi:hypothetical protein
MAWFPQAFPLEKYKGNISGEPVMRMIYSRPHLNGRTLGKNLVMPDTLWRMGANENNEWEFFKQVNISGKIIEKGKYIIYCLPHHDSWRIFISRDINSWGLSLDTSRAILKTELPLEKNPFVVESLTMVFNKIPGGASLQISWGDITARLPVMIK